MEDYGFNPFPFYTYRLLGSFRSPPGLGSAAAFCCAAGCSAGTPRSSAWVAFSRLLMNHWVFETFVGVGPGCFLVPIDRSGTVSGLVRFVSRNRVARCVNRQALWAT